MNTYEIVTQNISTQKQEQMPSTSLSQVSDTSVKKAKGYLDGSYNKDKKGPSLDLEEKRSICGGNSSTNLDVTPESMFKEKKRNKSPKSPKSPSRLNRSKTGKKSANIAQGKKRVTFKDKLVESINVECWKQFNQENIYPDPLEVEETKCRCILF